MSKIPLPLFMQQYVTEGLSQVGGTLKDWRKSGSTSTYILTIDHAGNEYALTLPYDALTEVAYEARGAAFVELLATHGITAITPVNEDVPEDEPTEDAAPVKRGRPKKNT